MKQLLIKSVALALAATAAPALVQAAGDRCSAASIGLLGAEKAMFDAADPPVFEWYVKNYGADVSLFVDHSQIVQLGCLRSGTWGTKTGWGRVMTCKEG